VGDVLVHLGSANYLQRYKVYVGHVREWRQQFQKLESVDLRYDNQIVVNPDMQAGGATRRVALNPAAARAAIAAGVKPAALITRLGQKNKPVPKPAFELTESKLNPKAAVARKPAPRPKVKVKTAALKGHKLRPSAKRARARAKAASAADRKLVAQKTTAGRAPLGQSGLTAVPASAAPKPSPAIGKQQASQGPN
jgi:cell division protein FtsQ